MSPPPPPASPPPPAPGLSPDGTILVPGQGGSLVANSGMWSFGSATNAYGTVVLLNGQPIAGSYAVELEVANGGNLFNQNAQSNGWYEWNGSGWTSSSSPTLSPPPPPASPPPPPPGLSPDGTILVPGQGGSLVANSGIWSRAEESSVGEAVVCRIGP